MHIDGVLLTSIEYIEGKVEYGYSLPQKKGKVIRICCSKVNLAIAELEVYGSTTKGEYSARQIIAYNSVIDQVLLKVSLTLQRVLGSVPHKWQRHDLLVEARW